MFTNHVVEFVAKIKISYELINIEKLQFVININNFVVLHKRAHEPKNEYTFLS